MSKNLATKHGEKSTTDPQIFQRINVIYIYVSTYHYHLLFLPFIYTFWFIPRSCESLDSMHRPEKKCFFSTAASRNGPGFWEGTLEFSIRTLSARKSGHPKGRSRPGWPAACLVVGGVGLGSYFVEDTGDFSYKKPTSLTILIVVFWKFF